MSEEQNLPDSVQKQKEDAEKAMEAMKERRSQESVAPTANTAKAVVASEPEIVMAEKSTVEAPVTIAPTQEQVGQDYSELARKAAALEQEKAQLQKKLDTFHGSYGGEVQRLKSQIVDLQKQLKDMPAPSIGSGQPLEVSQGEPGETPEPKKGTKAHLKYVTQDAIERYGPEFYEEILNVTKGVNEGNIEELKKVALEAKEHAEKLRTELHEERFWSEVESMAPGAKSINGDPISGVPCSPGWGKFLDEPIRQGSVTTRRTEAENAFVQGNARAFASLVREFDSLQRSPSNESGPKRPTVLAQAVPRSVLGNAPSVKPSGSGKRIVPRSEIDKFSAEAGKGTMTPEEANAKTREYAEAVREGRISDKM